MHAEILKLLLEMGQEQLALQLDTLSTAQQKAFLDQLRKLSTALLHKQRSALLPRHREDGDITPLNAVDTVGDAADQKSGEALIAQGKMGCIILAGGQGTRLGAGESKGMIPVSLVKNKSLFQIFFERTKAASKRAGRALPLAVMTSPRNLTMTQDYLEKHHFFQLSKEQIDLFVQEELPFLDDEGNWALEAPGKIAEGPDGNGGVFKAFCQSGIWKKWKQQGVEFVNIVLIDNPLADPFDAELCGYHARQKAEVTVKAVIKKDPQEKVGVLTLKTGHIKVIEYSELSDAQKNGVDEEGDLRFKIASISLFCFQMDFIPKAADSDLLLHIVRKQARIYKKDKMEKTHIWKCEYFIFDLLAQAKQIRVLVYPRETCFAPLKNASGEASIQTVQKALLIADRTVYAQVTGIHPPERLFELDPQFYYPTPALLQRWKGKTLPSAEYIDAGL